MAGRVSSNLQKDSLHKESEHFVSDCGASAVSYSTSPIFHQKRVSNGLSHDKRGASNQPSSSRNKKQNWKQSFDIAVDEAIRAGNDEIPQIYRKHSLSDHSIRLAYFTSTVQRLKSTEGIPETPQDRAKHKILDPETARQLSERHGVKPIPDDLLIDFRKRKIDHLNNSKKDPIWSAIKSKKRPK